VKLLWRTVPLLLQEDLERYLAWTTVPDPLAEGARPRALAPLTRRTRRIHVHSAVSAAIAAGIPIDQITCLASLVEAATFRSILGQLWRADGGKVSAYTHAVAITLLAIASEWVKLAPDVLAGLKSLTRKLGRLPSGLTEKNKCLLRRFDDPRLTADLIELPDKLWNTARRRLGQSRWAFNDLQTALAIDLLLHVPMRLQNLVSLNFTEHVHWPQGPRRPAILTIKRNETKNEVALEFEIPSALAERMFAYRNEIAPELTGERPDRVFVNLAGNPKHAYSVAVAIQKALARHLGVKMNPHQFRHLAAKIVLDANPGAYELVRQLLGHKSHLTTTNFYAGIDTRRAGRAHAELLQMVRGTRVQRSRHRRPPLRGAQ
jgi:integrase